MTSILIFIASCIAVIAGIGYFIFKYAPMIAEMWNGVVSNIELITAIIPDWLLPYVGIILAICVVGLLIKLL